MLQYEFAINEERNGEMGGLLDFNSPWKSPRVFYIIRMTVPNTSAHVLLPDDSNSISVYRQASRQIRYTVHSLTYNRFIKT